MKTDHVRISGSEKITLISNLSTMLFAGIPIYEAVMALLEDTKGGQRKILETLRDDLSQGRHVWESFSKFPLVFDKVLVNIIKASEEAGTLETTLKDLQITIRKEQEFTGKVKSAFIYPLFIFIVFVGVMVIILTFVIPRISQVFIRLKVHLPLATKMLIFLSDLLLKQTVFLLGGIAVVVVGFILFYRMQRAFILNLLFSLPLISRLVKEIDLTRFSRNLYLLLSSGIPIIPALEMTEQVVIKKDVARVIRHARSYVLAGKKMSEGFKDARKIIPSMVIKITEAGERTGTLDRSMQDISEFLDFQVSATLKTVTALLEPVMLVAVGLLVGGIMLAIIAPIYSLIGQVGPQ